MRRRKEEPMNLIRREPTTPYTFFRPFEAPLFREMEEMTERFNKLFKPFDLKEPLTVADFTPAVDIQETDNEYLVKAELPEVKKEDVKVTVENGILTIQGERKLEKEEKGRKYHRLERSYGTFLRTFTVPLDADETKVAADFKEGLLKVHIPKTEKARPKAIEVKVS
jgi:HSP20 family protein